MQGGSFQQLPVAGIEGLAGDGLGLGLRAQLVDAVGLPLAHEAAQAGEGVLQLIVDFSPDLVDQVGLLAVHIGGDKGLPFPGRAKDQLSQQGGGRLQNMRVTRHEGVVQEAAPEADALDLPFFADDGLNAAAVQIVQGGGQGLHIRVVLGAPAQNLGQQGVKGGGFLRQWGQKGGGEHGGFEFFRLDHPERYAGGQGSLGDWEHGYPPLG